MKSLQGKEMGSGHQQYDNFDVSNTHEADEGYDDSKGEDIIGTQQTDPQVSSIGLNQKKIDDTENHATNYQGEDIGMIHENEQGQGTQQIRLKKVKNNVN